MVKAMWWLVGVLALVVTAGARAQYQGYLPVQTEGSEQAKVSLSLTNRYRWLPLLLAVILSPAWAQPPQPAPVRFTEIMERFARQQKVNVLTEYLMREEAGTMSGVSPLPEAPTAEDIARVYGREVIRVGSTLVFRSLDSYDYLRFNEERHLNIFGDLMWKGKQLQVQAKKHDDGTLRVTIKATGVPLKELCERFQKETGWKVEVDPELQNTRIFARWQSASPGEVVEAISVLLQTDVEVKLSLSEAQKEARKQARERLLRSDPMAERLTRSDELLQQLLPLLTPEEMDRFKRGEMVDLPLSRLPEDVHERALQYVEYALHVLETMKPDPQLSQLRDRLRQLEITLHLPSATPELHIFSGGIGISLRDPETGFETSW